MKTKTSQSRQANRKNASSSQGWNYSGRFTSLFNKMRSKFERINSLQKELDETIKLVGKEFTSASSARKARSTKAKSRRGVKPTPLHIAA